MTPRVVIANRFPGRCFDPHCDKRLAAGEGFSVRDERFRTPVKYRNPPGQRMVTRSWGDGPWRIYCKEHLPKEGAI